MTALEDVHREALADWLDERPPREKPDHEETAGLGARRDDAPPLAWDARIRDAAS